MRVLVTGAAGSLGEVVTVGLADRGHEVIALDVAEPQGAAFTWHVADCTDPGAIAEVFGTERLDAVVHLAGIPTESDLPDALTSHVITTGVLLDACVRTRVSRFVFASSNHAVGRIPRDSVERLTVDVQPRPDTLYGVGKVAAEGLLSLYADRYAIDAIACRIGSFLPEPTSVRALSTWLSPDDAVRMFDAALTAPAPGFALLYGISANTRAWWDLEPGRALGYEPLDDAETFADQIEPRADDKFEGQTVGGPFTGREFYRPSVDF